MLRARWPLHAECPSAHGGGSQDTLLGCPRRVRIPPREPERGRARRRASAKEQPLQRRATHSKLGRQRMESAHFTEFLAQFSEGCTDSVAALRRPIRA